MMRRRFAYRHSPAEGPVVVCADLRSRKVPPEKLVKGNNRVGFALAWPDYLGGHPAVRCFMPGTSG
jgi:hypothetical protein